jgi:hypothetical protein
MGNVVELRPRPSGPKRPRREGLDKFAAWAAERSVSAAEAGYVYCHAMIADRWLCQERDVLMALGASERDLRAYLLATRTTGWDRNEIVEALRVFGDFLVDQDITDVTPARDLEEVDP